MLYTKGFSGIALKIAEKVKNAIQEHMFWSYIRFAGINCLDALNIRYKKINIAKNIKNINNYKNLL